MAFAGHRKFRFAAGKTNFTSSRCGGSEDTFKTGAHERIQLSPRYLSLHADEDSGDKFNFTKVSSPYGDPYSPIQRFDGNARLRLNIISLLLSLYHLHYLFLFSAIASDTMPDNCSLSFVSNVHKSIRLLCRPAAMEM